MYSWNVELKHFSEWVRGKAHPGQFDSPSQGNPETHRKNNHTHIMFLFWEEVGLPRENPCMQGENMKTLRRKTPGVLSLIFFFFQMDFDAWERISLLLLNCS
ncbi:hypothetical protein GOODEAATRI_009626 [Goodea atripinnis]|uniref:Uncharacterized protein n=1 Tax=Goodea atripinnis TaxID=208336 RepID=A0ABV0N0A1_9TELE